MIPGMSVQPVVENAIQHGLEKMERGGEIQVLVRRKETCIEVTIRDNGCGMEPELLAAIRRGGCNEAGVTISTPNQAPAIPLSSDK